MSGSDALPQHQQQLQLAQSNEMELLRSELLNAQQRLSSPPVAPDNLAVLATPQQSQHAEMVAMIDALPVGLQALGQLMRVQGEFQTSVLQQSFQSTFSSYDVAIQELRSGVAAGQAHQEQVDARVDGLADQLAFLTEIMARSNLLDPLERQD